MIKKIAILLYAGLAYIIGLINIAYIVGFLANFGVPKGINDGPEGPVWLAIVIDAALVSLFGLHHSVTARASFKAWWAKWISPAIERATYLYMTAGMTALLVVFWRPVDITIWHIENPILTSLIILLYLAVLVIMFSATFIFGHLGFFGIEQAWKSIREHRPEPGSFSANYLYAFIRHPISFGWMVIPWITPHMTVGQLVFAVSVTAYILLATPFEEADLIEEHGDVYRDYQKNVPPFIPGTKP